MIAHFFDIDVLLLVNNKVWIVDKSKPNIPILKLSKYEFNLIKSGVYKSQNNSIKMSGTNYYLPIEIFEQLKIKVKNFKSDLSNLMFSMQEFLNKEVIDNIDFTLNVDAVRHLVNKTDDIYIICSSNSKNNYQSIIDKFENKIQEIGLQIKKFYFISETFYNRDEDKILHKKDRLLLQHSVGYKTDDDKFTNEELEQYDEIYYYDDDRYSVNFILDSNKLLSFLISNSEDSVKSELKCILSSKPITIFTNLYTSNKLNLFIKNKVVLEWSNIVKTFENFKY